MDHTEQAILQAIEAEQRTILDFAEDVLLHPEPSDGEVRTATEVAELFRGLGLSVQTGLSGTGVLARMGERRPCVVLIGELDAVRCPGHPFADSKTGAAHACGHHAQLAALVGAAIALTRPEIRAKLDGSLAFFAVPAEERGAGKCRLIADGTFDGMDVAVTHHTHFTPTGVDVLLGNMRCNGVIMKRITMQGKAAHAGGAPHEGINALSAASLGMAALGYLRETFRDEDGVRVHGIVVEGGAAQNVVPERVVMEYGVRANNSRALEDANGKVNRAFEAGALAMGAKVEIQDLFAYAPVPYAPATAWQQEIAALVRPKEKVALVRETDFHAASTDVGDLCNEMPVVNFTTGGFSGMLHSVDYRMEDEDTALLLPARLMALSAYRLLRDGAREAMALLS